MATTRRTFLRLLGGASGALAARLDVPPAFAQTGPVKIGVLAAKAGVTAPVGESGLRGTQFAVDRINAAGGILGRRIELVVEEESNPKDTVERFRKLGLQSRVDVITGVVSTGVGLAIGPVAEELKTLWLAWDATTQKGVEETMPKPRYSFRSVDNEAEAVMASILTAKHLKGKIKTVAGINNDYSYGRDNWAAFLAIMKKLEMGVTPVVDLWPKLGETNFTSHVAALGQARPDLIFCSFWSADAPILMKQAHAAGLTATTKFVMTTAGGVHESLKKAFTPEGMILGYNSMYFEAPNASPLLREFVRWHQERFKEWPNYESDHAYFTLAAYRAAVEKAARAAGGKWPSTDQIIEALEGIEVESLSGKRSYRADHVMECSFFQGLSTHRNKHDFVTIDPVEVMSTRQIQKPSGTGLYEWINSWKA
ncbi:MAG: amino acid ABC transporter substrate-binding protein [Candidatus Rokubacteria bacterium 13_1_40CM_69_27]|nr:MAG: amino acid ABC transporter substrate-binding protein [Candidatus Rokubacteria bacterium 13_1_40CM_69_27]OLC30871.1 MAG: amino acid ABC transporter substrate-binding protein [Candidatus Rokubacteria bacterium 13_1_40CM_4_69_5]OLE38180.1 MAG: amino acid ABC transporter substrate-binding protein [Candidatus Rokubacteria bacterium 13_1_20CM_2_70_7]